MNKQQNNGFLSRTFFFGWSVYEAIGLEQVNAIDLNR